MVFCIPSAYHEAVDEPRPERMITMWKKANQERRTAPEHDGIPELIARYGMRMLNHARRIGDFWPSRWVK